jgi:hypothetical protein
MILSIICSDFLLLGWWQTLTVSSFVQILYCWDGDRHWQYHHHLFWHFIVGMVKNTDNTNDDDTVSVCHHPKNKMSEQMMMILSVSVTIPTIKCPKKWWYYQCLQTLTVSSSFVRTFYCCDGDRHWQYHHLCRNCIVGMVTDTDSIIIICSDILLLGWW